MTDTLLAVFTGLLAFAILMQSVLFLLTFLNLRRLIADLLPQIQELAEKIEATLAAVSDIAENIRPVARKLADSAEIIHNRVVEADGFLGEIMETSRREIAGIEDALHDVTQRIQNVINILSDGIFMPINRVNAMTKAVRVALGVLFRRREKEKTDANASSADSKDDTIFF
jgi:methyl-accepting chemotaxis protein